MNPGELTQAKLPNAALVPMADRSIPKPLDSSIIRVLDLLQAVQTPLYGEPTLWVVRQLLTRMPEPRAPLSSLRRITHSPQCQR